jgi:hypothetical protein
VPNEHSGPSQNAFSVHVPAFSAALLETERRS